MTGLSGMYSKGLEPFRQGSGMTAEFYLSLLRRLGFTQAERGKVLEHPSKGSLNVYLNWNRDGVVYFTGYLKFKERYPSAYWVRCKPMQKVDDLPKFITLVPLQGLEAVAIASLLDGVDT